LWKQSSGWQERERSGENFQNITENGTAFLVDLTIGVKKQIWNLLHTFCINDPDLEYVMIDATIVRAHACAAGYKKQNSEGLGRSKGGFTTKIHASV